MNLTFIATIVAGAAGFALAWNLQAHQITKQERDHANERMAIQREAHKVKERQTDAVITAQNAGAARAVVLKRDADSARAAVDGLRDDLDTTMRAAATSIDACNVANRTTSELLAVCAVRYIDMAGKAQGHFSDVRTLVEAWPR